MMLKRSTALLIAKVYFVTVLGFALNLYFYSDVFAGPRGVKPPGVAKEVMVFKKCQTDKPTELKAKDTHQAESTSIISKLLSFELPKISFGDFAFSAQKALLDKLPNNDAALPPPPCGKTSQYIKNGVLHSN